MLFSKDFHIFTRTSLKCLGACLVILGVSACHHFPHHTEPQVETMTMDSASIAQNLSTSNVQVFSLDGPAPQIANINNPYMLQGTPTRRDPRVMAYSYGESEYFDTATYPYAGGPYNEGYDNFASSAPMQPRGVTGTETIYFNHGQTSLDSQDHQVIGHVASAYNGMPLHVKGHASARTETNDPTAANIVNLRTSMDRAYNVSKALIRSGIPPQQIETRAYGATIPSYDEASSRRVEITPKAVAVDVAPVPAPIALAPAYAPPPSQNYAPRLLPNYGQ